MADYIDLPVAPKVALLTTLPTSLQDGEAFIGGTKYSFRHIKQEEEEVDFRRYIFMEPEGAAKSTFCTISALTRSFHLQTMLSW